jgi:hypothetical protein
VRPLLKLSATLLVPKFAVDSAKALAKNRRSSSNSMRTLRVAPSRSPEEKTSQSRLVPIRWAYHSNSPSGDPVLPST